MKTKKIIKALKVIKKYCNSKGEDCGKCMFNETGLCSDVPEAWNIEDLEIILKDIEEL